MAAVGLTILWFGTDDDITRGFVTAAIVVVGSGLILFENFLARFGVESVAIPGVFEVHVSAAAGEDESDVGGALDTQGSDTERWLATRWRIEMKLTYLAKHTLPDHANLVKRDARVTGWDRPYLSIGSLNYDELLQREDATLATTFLALSPTDLERLDRRGLDEILDKADALAGNLRLKVFREILRKYLAGLDCSVERDGDRFFRVVHREAGAWRIAPVFGLADGALAKARLRDIGGSQAEHAVVVVPIPPNAERSARRHPSVSRLVVRIDQLPEALGLQSGEIT
ncbi:MAG: hypothetical protein ACXVL8_19850 [Acidimicrobiia bacterium]